MKPKPLAVLKNLTVPVDMKYSNRGVVVPRARARGASNHRGSSPEVAPRRGYCGPAQSEFEWEGNGGVQASCKGLLSIPASNLESSAGTAARIGPHRLDAKSVVWGRHNPR